MKLFKKKIPEKCLDCSMEEEYRPLHSGCCGVCITNKNKGEKDKKKVKKILDEIYESGKRILKYYGE